MSSRIHTHPVQWKSKWDRKPRRKILWKYVFLCVSWQFRSILDQSQTKMYWAQRTKNIYNVCHYLNYAILAMSLLSDIEIFSSLFMLKKHLVGLDTYFSVYTHTCTFSHEAHFQHIHGMNFCVCVCFFIIWEFHSHRFYVQSTWLL